MKGRKVAVEEDVRRELEAHIAIRTEELEREGWHSADARLEAQRLFGNLEALQKECHRETSAKDRAMSRTLFFDGIWQDVKFAVRTLRKSAGFTTVAITTLALGIGANTAIFSVISQVVLASLPYPNPDELITVEELNSRGSAVQVAGPNFGDWEDQATSLQHLAGYQTGSTTILGGDEAALVRMASVSEDFFPALGLSPETGRSFTANEHVPGVSPVVIVSYRFWQNQLGGGSKPAGKKPRGPWGPIPRDWGHASRFQFSI